MMTAATTLVAVAFAVPARASQWDVFGFGPEGVASVSARAASATDGTAVFYNPAGLAFGSGYRLELSGAAVASGLEAQGTRQRVAEPVGADLALAADVPLEGPLAQRVRVGMGLHALPSKLLQLDLRKSAEPQFPYYSNRTQRLTVIPALSVRLTEWLGVGLGANALAGVSGPVDVREGQSRGLETLIEQDARTVVSWVAGIRVDPTPQVHVALVYRQQFGVPFHVTTTANVAGVPLSAEVTSAQALFEPTCVVIAAAVEPTERLRLEVDGTWQRWSSWDGPLLGLDTTVSALSLSTRAPTGLFRDTLGLRGSASWTVSQVRNQRIAVLAGTGYETSILDPGAQQGRTNFVDGAKVFLGGGASAQFAGVVGETLRMSLGAQVQRVSSTTQAKEACTSVPCPAGTVVGPDTEHPDQGIDNPGYPSLSGRGLVFVLSAGAEVAW